MSRLHRGAAAALCQSLDDTVLHAVASFAAAESPCSQSVPRTLHADHRPCAHCALALVDLLCRVAQLLESTTKVMDKPEPPGASPVEFAELLKRHRHRAG